MGNRRSTVMTRACWTAAIAAVAMNCPVFAQSNAPERPWTLLVYGAADNNADGPIQEFLDTVRKALDDDPGMELVLFIDRSDKHSEERAFFGENFSGARLYRLRSDSTERLSGGTQFPEITLDKDVELDSADAANIGKLIAWGKANYPAKHYGLMIYSHANGRTMCPDDQSDRGMCIPELTAKVGPENSVDFMALELCNMAGMEIAYQWRPDNGRFGAEALVAIPNAGPPLDWNRAFARIRTPGHDSPASRRPLNPATMTALDFGKLVIEEGYEGRLEAGRGRMRPMRESAGCFNLRAAKTVKQAVDALAKSLSKCDCRDAFLELRASNGRDSIITYDDGASPYVDLYDLCKRAAASPKLPSDVRSAAEAAMAAVDEFVVASFGTNGYNDFESNKEGIFIVLPSEPSKWKNFHWYTPLAGEGRDYGRWAFLSDGATPGNGVVENWFELLDAWFDAPGSSGGENGYAP